MLILFPSQVDCRSLTAPSAVRSSLPPSYSPFNTRSSYLAGTRTRGQVCTVALGCLIFFDDYSSILIVGNSLRDVVRTVGVSGGDVLGVSLICLRGSCFCSIRCDSRCIVCYRSGRPYVFSCPQTLPLVAYIERCGCDTAARILS